MKKSGPARFYLATMLLILLSGGGSRAANFAAGVMLELKARGHLDAAKRLIEEGMEKGVKEWF